MKIYSARNPRKSPLWQCTHRHSLSSASDFNNRRPALGELPWMKRDLKEAMKLTSRINTHTTPIKLPSLKPAAGEELGNDLYQQKAEKGADPSPPPAVTIPLDRVDPKYRLFDDELGAPTGQEQTELELAEPVSTTARKELAKPNFAAAGSPALPDPAVVESPVKPAGAPIRTSPPPSISLNAPTPTSRPKPGLPPLKRPEAPKSVTERFPRFFSAGSIRQIRVSSLSRCGCSIC